MNIWVSSEIGRFARVELSADDIRRALGRAAVEKANERGMPYHWSDRVEMRGLMDERSVLAELRDGPECAIVLSRLQR